MTGDGNYTVLITELNDTLKEYLYHSKNENIYKIFDGLYNVLYKLFKNNYVFKKI